MSLSTPSEHRPNIYTTRHRLTSLQGIMAAVAFSVLLSGSNANTPLLPLYRSLMGFSPLTMSLTFVCYVGVTLIFLIGLSRPSIIRWSPALLAASLLASICADISMAAGSEATTLIGRALTGLAVGLGTGSAAALVVDAFGVRGRPVSATGNIVGAVFGTVLSQVAVSLLDGRVAIRSVFHIHALICAVLFVVLAAIFRSMRHSNRRAFATTGGKMPKIRASLVANWLPLVTGSVAWIAISAAITFLPTLFREGGMSIVASSGMIILLICCAACQLGSVRVARLLPMANGLELLLAGIMLIVVAALSGYQSVGLAGFALTGAGIGISYRIALVVLTKGAPPTIHGVLSSTYAAITYAIAAVAVALIGFVGNRFGLQQVVIGTLVVLALCCAVLLKSAPRVSLEKR